MTEQARQQTTDILNKVNKKEKKKHYYPSNNGYIVNAKTGIQYPIKFKSKDTSALYHVIDSSAKYDKHGYIRDRKINYINEPNHLFYDSPEQYKMHHGSNITTDEIIAWHKKQQELNINIYNTDLEPNEEIDCIEVK